MGYQSPPQSLSNGTVFAQMQWARQSGLGDQSRKAACFASPVCPLSWRRLPPHTTWVSIRALQVQKSQDTRGSRALRSRGTAVRARSLEPEGWGGLPEESRTQQDPASPGCWAGSGRGGDGGVAITSSIWAIAGTGNRRNFNAGDVGWCGMCPIPGDVNEACGHDRREDTADSSGLWISSL